MIKRILSLAISLIMILSIVPVSTAVSAEETEGKRLFARWSDASGFLDSSEVHIWGSSPLVFCFGTKSDYTFVTDLTTTGVAVLDMQDAAPDNAPCFSLSVTGLGKGAVVYTDTDGTEYTYDVQGMLGYPGDLIAKYPDTGEYVPWISIAPGKTMDLKICLLDSMTSCSDLPADAVLSAEGAVTVEKVSGNVFRIGVTGENGGSVYYQNGDQRAYLYIGSDGSGDPGFGEEVRLFAAWVDFSGFLDCMHDLPVGMGTWLCFCLGTQDEYIVLSDNLSATGSVTISDGGLNENMQQTWSIGTNGTGPGAVIYTDPETNETYQFDFTVVENSGGSGQNPDTPDHPGNVFPFFQDVLYEGKTVSVVIGEIWDDEEFHDVGGFGDSYGANYYMDFCRRFVLGGFSDYNGNKESLPPRGFYDCISDVSFALVGSTNEFENSDQLNCWLANEPNGVWQDCTSIIPVPYESQSLGIHSVQTYVRANAGQGFDTTLTMTFTYDDPADNIDAATYTIGCSGFYHSSGDIILDASTGEAAALVDTAEELNQIFSSYENLLNWVQMNFPESFLAYKAPGTITLNLPVVTYEDIVVVQAKGVYTNTNMMGPYIIFNGSRDETGKRTTMPGILARAGLHQIRHIDFVYNPEVAYDAFLGNNKELSYGILADCSQRTTEPVAEEDPIWNDICSVGDCTFTGFDYGMCSTKYGYAGEANGCTFTGCYYGIYIDGNDQYGGGNDNFSHNHFIGNKFAVWIRSLPGGSTPYSMRFCDNIFLKNHKEFKVTTSGNKHYFHFYRNFYGGMYQNGLMLLSDEEDVARAAEVELTDDDGTVSSAVVLTDPCRTSQEIFNMDDLWIFSEMTSILNEEAKNMLIAQEALTNTEITLLGTNEEEIAVWTFGENNDGGVEG